MSSRDRDVAAALARLATTADFAFTGLAIAAGAVACWVKYFTASAALGRISAAPSVPISGLRSLVSSSADGDSEGKPFFVVVRGRVQPSSALEAVGGWVLSKTNNVLTPRGSDEKAVAVLHTQMVLYNELRGMFSWGLDLHSLFARSWNGRKSSSLRMVPFALVEDCNRTNSGYVHVTLEGSAHPLPLTTVHHELHPVQFTLCQFILALCGGYPVALVDEEKILPVGKEITAIGICRERDGGIEIKSSQDLPCFLTELTKDDLVTDLSFTTKILFWSGVVFGTLSVGILGYALIRNLLRWKEWRMRKRRQIEDLNNEALANSTMEQEDVPDGELCVICLQTRRRSAFVPCGHLVCCAPCASRVERNQSPNCPVCRQSVRSSLRIYDS